MYANELEIEDGKLTGRYVGEIVDGRRKAELLKLIAQVEHVHLAQTIAVGDGANDLPMLSEAGLGIAFHAKPRVVANAKQSINTMGLDGVLYFLGFKDSYLEERGENCNSEEVKRGIMRLRSLLFLWGFLGLSVGSSVAQDMEREKEYLRKDSMLWEAYEQRHQEMAALWDKYPEMQDSLQAAFNSFYDATLKRNRGVGHGICFYAQRFATPVHVSVGYS